VWRDGAVVELPVADVVPGDVVELGAGSVLPGDGVFLEAQACQVDEAALTGETFPVEKRPGPVAADTPLAGRVGAGWMGTSVATGTARLLVVAVGADTQVGGIAADLGRPEPETAFEAGVRGFGATVTRAMAVLVVAVLAVLVYADRPILDALLFAVALAVGLAPELLPAILAVNLAQGARRMGDRGVLVRRLSAIEDFGAMDTLCTDKTGTLTLGEVRVEGAVDPSGQADPVVLTRAALNAALQRGLLNPIDAALIAAAGDALPVGVERVGEVPYDFRRKRLSVAVRDEHGAVLLTKGAVVPVLDVCTTVRGAPLDAAARADALARLAAWGAQGIRALAVAQRPLPPGDSWSVADEHDLDLLGFLLLSDPPKPGVAAALRRLQGLGVEVVVVSGDNRHAVRHLAVAVGLPDVPPVTGAEVDTLDEVGLAAVARHRPVFAETDPGQKARAIRALRARGRVVGYLGDGVNDAPPLHAADVGLSVSGAVDVAREAADLVLVGPDLDVLTEGILEGRRIFANTLKYVLTTESANLGNMLSMAATAVFLPFLPLLPTQILLNNFLSDIPALAMASDRVDADQLARPVRWDQAGIARFMVVFGLVSTAFDLATFAVLLEVFRAEEGRFRTAWFVESLLTELAVALLVRTRMPAWRSRPGTALLISTVLVAAFAPLLPVLPLGRLFALEPLPIALVAALVGITLGYVVAVEVAKHFFWRTARA